MSETEHSLELQAAVREIIEDTLGISFAEIFEVYKDMNPDLELTEKDLIQEIMQAGQDQNEGDAAFEDVVMIGAIAIGGTLGLM